MTHYSGKKNRNYELSLLIKKTRIKFATTRFCVDYE